MTRAAAATFALLAGLALLAPPASALYLATPLVLHPSASEANVGDTVTFRIEPINESAQRAWAGKSVQLVYAWDANQPSPGNATSSDAPPAEEKPMRKSAGSPILLDANATATATWTIPAEVDDKNVFMVLESPEGEQLAQADLAIGDAEPMARIAASGPGSPEPVRNDAEESGELPSGTPAPTTTGGADARDTPLAPIAALAALAIAGLALATRRPK